jgi:LacI family transcriptional regulator
METNPISLKLIAEKLKISITTVSKALKDYKDVSPKTKEAVINLAKELNYTPNSFAVNLRTQKSKTIGLIIPEVVHHFFSNVIKGIIEEAEKKDYLVIILQSNESKVLEKKQIQLLLNKRVDGIIMSLSNQSNNEDYLHSIIEKNTPLILFDKISKLINCTKVIIDDQKAAAQATQHLIDIGCKNIAHIRGPENPQNAIDRFLGYKKTLEKNNILFNPELVFICKDVTFEEGYQFASEIHKNHPKIDGIFIITDLVAVGVINYFNEKNIKIPEEVAVVGFSNWFMSQVITPKLSTIDQPSLEMGKVACQLLIDEIDAQKNGIKIEKKIITLDTNLIQRASTLKVK